MCGIIGYVGRREAQSVLLAGLKTLEYRGYDSAGLYVTGGGVRKTVGKVAALEAVCTERPCIGSSGIAHTRWATHGEPSTQNAHPHVDASQSIYVVHNGIIENWREIKEGLLTQGITTTSQTDTEVLAKLIGSLYEGDLTTAVGRALAIVRGTYGIAVMSDRHPDMIVVARLGSPLVIGVGDSEHIIASDPSAVIPYTTRVVYLEDGEMATVTPTSYTVTSLQGTVRQKFLETIDWDIALVQKGGYDHFMLKEIHDIPDVMRATMQGRVQATDGQVKLGGLELVSKRLAEVSRLTIVGCGSASYAGQVGRLWLEEYAGFPVTVELGSEYRYKRHYPDKREAVLAVTQSGETADTLASIREAKRLGLLSLGMVNVVGSTIARETEAGIYNHAGPEMAVASTKAFISQLTAFVLITVFIGRQKGMTNVAASELLTALESLPDTIARYLTDTRAVEAAAERLKDATSTMFIGRKFLAPIAFEGALKLKECTYIHAEAYPAGELKHGPIALLDRSFPVVALVGNDDVREKVLSNIEEVRARQAPVIVIARERDTAAAALADTFIPIPKVHPMLEPIMMTIPLQLLAYYTGTRRGINVDQPRNLAKSVTVE